MGILKRIFKFLGKVFSPLVVIGLIMLIAAVLIWVWGQRLSFRGISPFGNEDVRVLVALALLIIGSILLLIAIIRAIFAWVAARRAEREKPVREPTEEELEIAALDRAFDKATDVISRRWTGAGRGIYGLPWYLVIGPSQSGKSSLIEHSDLRFPIDHEITAQLQTLGPSKAVDMLDWRVAGNEAVMLDTRGIYFDRERSEDPVRNALWNRLLHNIRKKRPRRPINGVIVVVDFLEFSSMTHMEREELSAALRRDIGMLIEALGTRMTIHVLFAKLDLAGGFPDYFEAISGSEREALFGFHFTYEGRHTADWRDQFAQQYTQFTENLALQLKRRVYTLKNTTSRQEAFSLYRTFLGLEEPLKAFLNDTLSADRFTTPPLVRGVYFASSRQENVPRNVFLERVGARYALTPPLYGTSQAASYPYFSINILKKAVFPEAGLAGNNIKQERRYRNRAVWAAVIGAVVFIAGGAYWMDRYGYNLGRANDVLALTSTFTDPVEDGATVDATGATLLEPLDTIRAATFTFGEYRDVGAVAAQVSLYQGDRIGPIVDTAYRSVLNTRFGPLLTEGIERELRNVCPKGSDRELELLRVYRMMGELDGRDTAVVDGYFAVLWQRNFEANADTQNRLQSHLDHMLSSDPVAYDIDDLLISQAQGNLGGVAPFQRVYSTLRALGQQQLPDGIEFRTSAGTAFDIVYEPDPEIARQSAAIAARNTDANDPCGIQTDTVAEREVFEVPRIFTRQEYFDFFIPQNQSISRVAADDLWVLGQFDETEYSEEDYAQIQENLREIYVDDYIRTWRTALNEMRVRPFDDIRDAVSSLRALSGPNNPIRRVAELVRDHTIIYDQETVEVDENGATITDLDFDPDRAAALRINGSFVEIHRMLDDSTEGGATNIDEIQEALIALDSYVRGIADAPRPNARALELAIQRAQLQGEDPIFRLQRIAERAPAPFNDHLESIANESWRVIMSAATEEINRLWHEDTYGEYLRLIAGKYPFDRASETDLPLDDFILFFAPGGILDTFYNEQLLTFVDERTGEARVIDGQTLDVDPTFTRQLRSAIEITRTLFDANGEVYVEFTVAPVSLNNNLSRAVLNFEGQLINSSHRASQPITVAWPNILSGPVSSRVDLSALSRQGRSVGLQWDGPWSWLRLYDAAGRSNLTNNSVDITFANANGQAATFRIRAESSVNLFFNSPLTGFELPAYVRSPTG